MQSILPVFLPEWHPTKGVLVAWPFPDSDWQPSLAQAQACYVDVIKAISQVCEAWVLVHPSVCLQGFMQRLEDAGVNRAQLKCRNDIVYNDTWIRDYGPLSTTAGYVDFIFNGWGGKYIATADNAVAGQLTDWLGQASAPLDVVCEGGGLETNGRVLLVNRDCIVDNNRNPHLSEADLCVFFKQHLGVDAIEWVSGIQLTGDDTDGHIDTIARFVSEDCLVYAGRNTQHPDASALQALHAQLQVLANKQAWRLFELPSPIIYSQLDGRLLPATYANFLLCNGQVLLPIYGVPEDDAAITVLKAACPQYGIIPVRCEALLEQHGSLHCATMQIMALSKI